MKILYRFKVYGGGGASLSMQPMDYVICNSLTPSKLPSSLNLSPRTASKISDKDNQVKKSNDLGFVKNQPGDHTKHTSHIASPIIEIQNQSTLK